MKPSKPDTSVQFRGLDFDFETFFFITMEFIFKKKIKKKYMFLLKEQLDIVLNSICFQIKMFTFGNAGT